MTSPSSENRLRYDEGCLAAHALNVIGDRWSLLLVREILLKPKRFQAIRAGLPGVSASVLSQRLNALVAAGVVVHDADLGTYALTPSGQALKPVLIALCHWGSLHPGHDPRRFISPSALMISMMGKIDRDAARGCGIVAGMVTERESFTMRPDAEGLLQVCPGLDPGRDFTIGGTGNTLAIAIYGSRPLDVLAAETVITLEGGRAEAQAFADLFSLRHLPPAGA